jgi:hypothetical protein
MIPAFPAVLVLISALFPLSLRATASTKSTLTSAFPAALALTSAPFPLLRKAN